MGSFGGDESGFFDREEIQNIGVSFGGKSALTLAEKDSSYRAKPLDIDSPDKRPASPVSQHK
jgi:hypothetical protein